jgi:hypothetical protein
MKRVAFTVACWFVLLLFCFTGDKGRGRRALRFGFLALWMLSVMCPVAFARLPPCPPLTPPDRRGGRPVLSILPRSGNLSSGEMPPGRASTERSGRGSGPLGTCAARQQT